MNLETLQRIATLRETNHPELATLARRAATEVELESVWRLVGHPVTELSQLLRWRDGESVDSFLLGRAWRLMPVAQIAKKLSCFANTAIELGCEDARVNVPNEWPDEWVPFVDWNGQIFGILDARIESTTPVLGIDLASGIVSYWASSMDAFWTHALRELNSHETLSIDELMRHRVDSRG